MVITEHPTGAFTVGVHGSIRVVRETHVAGVTVVTGECVMDGEVNSYIVTAYGHDGSHGTVTTHPVLSWHMGPRAAGGMADATHAAYVSAASGRMY
jgi:hypothetical protein